MLADANNNEQVARAARVGACVAFAGNANALAVARARLHPHLQRLGALHQAFPVAYRAGVLRLAGAMATRAGDVELHAAAGLGDMAAAVALRTRRRGAHGTGTVAVRAGVKTRDVEAHDCAPDRVPKAHIDLVFEIGSPLRRGFDR